MSQIECACMEIKEIIEGIYDDQAQRNAEWDLMSNLAQAKREGKISPDAQAVIIPKAQKMIIPSNPPPSSHDQE